MLTRNREMTHQDRMGGNRQRATSESPKCARGGSRRSTRHTQGQNFCASTPPLEALKLVLSEIATGKS